MCFNWQVSLLTFVIGCVLSFILAKYGNPKYKLENHMSGIFFMFVALVQFMDFIFWIDLDNAMGLNKLMTLIGPWLVGGQPILVYILKIMWSKLNVLDMTNLVNVNGAILALNVCYFIYLCNNYIQFIQNGTLTTKPKHGHLSWAWKKYFNYNYYLIVLSINMFYLTNFNYSMIWFIISYLLLFLSYAIFNYNVGELWCFFGAFEPGIIYLLTKYLL